MTWTSDEPVLLFEDAIPVTSTAKAFAREPWTRQFFEDLKKCSNFFYSITQFTSILCFVCFFRAHQTHYEQIGKSRGHIRLKNDKQNWFIDNVATFRDHSYGDF